MPVNKIREVRKVLTLYGERGWHFVDDGSGYTEDSILRGFRNMNSEINKLAQYVTIHSVSYSHVVEPPVMSRQAQTGTLLVTATIVYSGHLDIIKVFDERPNGLSISRRQGAPRKLAKCVRSCAPKAVELHARIGRDRPALALSPDAPIIFNHEQTI